MIDERCVECGHQKESWRHRYDHPHAHDFVPFPMERVIIEHSGGPIAGTDFSAEPGMYLVTRMRSAPPLPSDDEGAGRKAVTRESLWKAIEDANEALFDIPEVDVEHQIDSHADTLPDVLRGYAAGAQKALDALQVVIHASLLDPVEPSDDTDAG